MDRLLRDLRYALRRVFRSPGFTLVAVLSLALGIGANTAIFSVVNAVLLRDLPLEEPDALLDLYLSSNDYPFNLFSYPEYRVLRDGTSDVFEGIALSRLGLVQADGADDVETLPVEMVNGAYFPLLGVKAALGRTLLPEDDVAKGAHPVVVLGHGYWQRAFGGDPGVLGREIRLTGRMYTVVGVAPEAYTGNLRGLVPDLYLPILMVNELQKGDEDELEAWGNHSYFVKARLSRGVASGAVDAPLGRVVEAFREAQPRRYQGELRIRTVPTADVVLYPPFDRVLVPALGLLLGVVGVVLLIACANLASFLLARAADRRREIALRLALGARRSVLVRQLLTETVLLAAFGGLAGLVLARWLLDALMAADLPLPIPIQLDLSLDGAVLAYTAAVAVGAGILFGLAPALQATRPDVVPALKGDGGGRSRSGAVRGFTLRDALVVGQVALSLVLLTGSGLLLRSLAARQAVDPGFGHAPAVVVGFGISPERYGSPEEGLEVMRALEERVRAVPGVTAVGMGTNIHLNALSTNTTSVRVDGVEPPPGRDFFNVDVAHVETEWFRAMGIELLRGRLFDDADGPGTDRVAVVNETFARTFYPGEDALGQTFRGAEDRTYTVVGVTRDTRVRTLGEAPRPFVYGAYRQDFDEFGYLVARTGADAGRTLTEVVRAIRDAEPTAVVFESRTMERHLAVMLLPVRLTAIVGAAFALLALALASVGLYGVVSWSVARRTREVGIRVSLGADARSVVALLMAGGLRLVVAGAAFGLLLSLLFARVLGRFLYGVPPLDPVTFALVPALLLAVGAVAAWIPARRATAIDPTEALRAQ